MINIACVRSKKTFRKIIKSELHVRNTIVDVKCLSEQLTNEPRVFHVRFCELCNLVGVSECIRSLAYGVELCERSLISLSYKYYNIFFKGQVQPCIQEIRTDCTFHASTSQNQNVNNS